MRESEDLERRYIERAPEQAQDTAQAEADRRLGAAVRRVLARGAVAIRGRAYGPEVTAWVPLTYDARIEQHAHVSDGDDGEMPYAEALEALAAQLEGGRDGCRRDH